jgi:hypothetical protein
MNVSEFERQKPKKTFRIIMGTLSKYERLLESHTSNKSPRPNDAALFETYTNIVDDLKAIKKSFLSGE